MTHSIRSLIAVLGLSLSIGAAASAQGRYGRGDVVTKDSWPDELVKRPLTLAEGLGQLDVPVVFNLSTNDVGKPVFVPLRLAYGVTDTTTLAITHQIGLCLTGTSNGCAKVYNDIGLEGLFSIAPTGPFQVALAAGLQFVSLSDPFAVAGVVGFDSRYGAGAIALRFDPRLSFGLNERDAGNRETLSLPVILQLQATPNVALSIGSGLFGPLNPVVGSFSDLYAIPLVFGVAYTTSRVDVGATFEFLNLRATGGASATDARLGQVFASLRF
jgi:hypothetical protein